MRTEIRILSAALDKNKTSTVYESATLNGCHNSHINQGANNARMKHSSGSNRPDETELSPNIYVRFI